MKLIASIFLCLLSFNISLKTVKGSELLNSFEFVNLSNVTLIDEYSEEDLEDHYEDVKKVKMFGWNYKMLNKNQLITFTERTLYSTFNKTMAIETLNYTEKVKEVTTVELSVKGSLSVDAKAGSGKFSGGLSRKIESELSVKKTNQVEIIKDINVPIFPMSKSTLQVQGRANVSNGVASKYIFFIRTKLGAFQKVDVLNRTYVVKVEPFYEENNNQ